MLRGIGTPELVAIDAPERRPNALGELALGKPRRATSRRDPLPDLFELGYFRLGHSASLGGFPGKSKQTGGHAVCQSLTGAGAANEMKGAQTRRRPELPGLRA